MKVVIAGGDRLFSIDRIVEREEREVRSTPAYGRRVSVCAVAGALFFFMVSDSFCFVFVVPSTIALSEL